MSVYIPGMEMPKSCISCPLIQCWSEPTTLADDSPFRKVFLVCGRTQSKVVDALNRLSDCPLVPVPEHGRLIDADALDDILADQSEDVYNQTHAPRSWEKALSVMRDYLDDAPTIIPADKEGE